MLAAEAQAHHPGGNALQPGKALEQAQNTRGCRDWGAARQSLEVENYLAGARREFSCAPPDDSEPPEARSVSGD